MEVASILENREKNKIYGLMGNITLTTNNSNIGLIKGGIFSSSVREYLNNPKAAKALKLVLLEEDILEKKGLELSNVEIKAVILAKALIDSKEIIVLEYFDKELNHKEKENYKRLFKKLTNDTNKTIVIYTNDLTFLWDIADIILLVDNNQVINTYEKTDCFKIVEQVDKPIIIDFITKIREKGQKVEEYKDIKDLLKAIYRLKEKEKNNEISN